jgi:hypothetical protein
MNGSDKILYCTETEKEYRLKDIKKLDSNTQKNIMRNWFYSNFEDPADNTPYESKEGGYIYIWGGPFNAREELESMFTNYGTTESINELVSELESICTEWSGKISSEAYDEYFYNVIYDNYEFTETLKNNLNNLKKLLKINLSPKLAQYMYKMLFVNVITILETFLSDAFIGTIFKDKQLLKDFVRSNKDFADRKFPLNEIFDRVDKIEKDVKTYLLELIWHNLAKVKNIYHSVLNIDFPKDMKYFYKVIAKRHDIVHRNGKTKSGDDVLVSRDELIELMDKVHTFAEDIDNSFNV